MPQVFHMALDDESEMSEGKISKAEKHEVMSVKSLAAWQFQIAGDDGQPMSGRDEVYVCNFATYNCRLIGLVFKMKPSVFMSSRNCINMPCASCYQFKHLNFELLNAMVIGLQSHGPNFGLLSLELVRLALQGEA